MHEQRQEALDADSGGRIRGTAPCIRGVFVLPVRSGGETVPYTKEEEQRRRAEIEPPVERTVEDAVLSYHPVRTFEKREVPEEKLLKILSLAQRAPSEWGVQPWRWLILRQREIGRA